MQNTKLTQQQKQTKVEFRQVPVTELLEAGGDPRRGGARGARGGRGGRGRAGAGRGDRTPGTLRSSDC